MSGQGRRLILVEFNELCPGLLDRWMAEGRLPNFRRFHDSAQVLTGTADVTEQQFLEPWIQWYSLHTGLGYDQHKVFHLTDGPRAGFTDIWHALLAAGHSVGNFAGMNAGAFAAPGSFYLPDPWCSTEPPYPAELATYQRIVVTKVQENSNATASVGGTDYARFLSFLAMNGLRGGTLMAIGRQLLAELSNRQAGWKRAALLDKLQLDLFLRFWKRDRPDFASFFLNSTAHFQHAYFHLLEPGQFALPAEDFADSEHRDAILYGYQQMDSVLADLLALERDGAMLVLSTALSQQPNPGAGRRYYRPSDAEALLARMGVQPELLLPVMAHQYSATFPDAAATEAARTRLAAAHLEGRPLFTFDPAPENTLFFGCGIGVDLPPDAQLSLARDSNATLPFFEHFYRVPHIKAGMHHPDSVLWFKTGHHAVHPGRCSILDIFPTLLEYYGVAAAPADGLPRRGRSFADRIGLGRFEAALPIAAE
ncbi:alkaline phosphatase family protein [Siccirubricoccus phaeus]|uniref:hypothetical protein n=1 Tax=Siccirubricoccus phaeus TaxID=2595053 RepID=UPI0011F3A70F|nr:hypothetical protein [Siccirubricoccus phaeus]